MNTVPTPLTDRKEAGQFLAARLQRLKHHSSAHILALSNGGVEVGATLSEELHLPLDVFLTQKLDSLNSPNRWRETATDSESTQLPSELFSHQSWQENSQSQNRVQKFPWNPTEGKKPETPYRKKIKPRSWDNKIIILVDDGIAHASSFVAAIHCLRPFRITRLIAAIPVGALKSIQAIRPLVDDLEVLERPEPFFAIENSYQFFPQVHDQQAEYYLRTANERLVRTSPRLQMKSMGEKGSIHDFQAILSPEFISRLLFSR